MQKYQNTAIDTNLSIYAYLMIFKKKMSLYNRTEEEEGNPTSFPPDNDPPLQPQSATSYQYKSSSY